MASVSPLRSPKRQPIPIDARAADHLRYIRETMERAAEFTAVPGWGGVAMGITALAAAFFASRQTTPRAWLAVWLVEAFVAVSIAAPAAATKAHRANSRLFSGPGRKFLLSFAPPISRDRRGVFRSNCAGDGPLFDGSGRNGAPCPRGVGGCPDGCGIRRPANLFRRVDCQVLRRIG